MSQPIPYSRAFNFSNWQAENPSLPLPANRLDEELGRLKQVTDQIRAVIKIIQRDDTALANTSVGYDQLKPELDGFGFNPPHAWAGTKNYIVRDTVFANSGFYQCLISHISTTFDADFDDGKWELIADFSEIAAVTDASFLTSGTLADARLSFTVTAFAKTLLDDVNSAAARATLGVIIGTDVQPYNANTTTWAGKTAPSGTVVGTSDAQALTNKTITQPTLTLKQSATPTPTAEGDIQWDTDDNVLAIGDGAATQLFLPAPASVAAGDVFYATGAKVLSRLAKGAAGQILTMNPGATAPQWSEPPVKLLTSGTVSAAAALSLNLTAYIAAGYTDFELDLRDFAPATDAVDLNLLISTNGGSSYVSTGYNARAIAGSTSGAVVYTNDSAKFKLANSVGNVAGRVAHTKLAMAIRSANFSVLGNVYLTNDSGTSFAGASGGENATAGVNAIQIKFSSGNITSGNYFLLGMRSN